MADDETIDRLYRAVADLSYDTSEFDDVDYFDEQDDSDELDF